MAGACARGSHAHEERTVHRLALPAAAAPVLVGSAVAYADGVFAFFPAFAAFLGALLLQIAVNLANDYFDYVKGIDTEDRLGPVRVTQSGMIPAKQVKLSIIIAPWLIATGVIDSKSAVLGVE